MMSAGDSSKIGGASRMPHSGSAVEWTPEGWRPFRMAEGDRLSEGIVYNRSSSRQPTGIERAFARWRIRFARYAPRLFGFIPINFNQRELSAYYYRFLPIGSQGGANIYLNRKDDYKEIVIAGRFYDLASFMDKLFNTERFSLGYRVASISATKTDSNITDDSLFMPGAKGKITALNHYNATTGIHEVTLLINSPDPAPIYDLLIKQLAVAIESFQALDEYEVEVLVGIFSNPAAKFHELLDWVGSSEAKRLKTLLKSRSSGIGDSGRENHVSVGLRLSPEGKIKAFTIRIIENIMSEMRDDAGTLEGIEKKFLNQSLWVGHLIDKGKGLPEILWEVSDSDLQGHVQNEHALLLMNQIQRLFVRDVHQMFLWEGYEPGETPSGSSSAATLSITASSGGHTSTSEADITSGGTLSSGGSQAAQRSAHSSSRPRGGSGVRGGRGPFRRAISMHPMFRSATTFMRTHTPIWSSRAISNLALRF